MKLTSWVALGVWLTMPPSRPAADETIHIRIDPHVSHQSIDGFGASDAWRCQFVGKNWPLEKRHRIADLLFSQEVDSAGNPQGIGLSIWRFYLSAGTAEQGDDSDIKNPWRRGECFQNADGSYDWTKLAGQQWFLMAARERGVEKFLAFPNAPPVHLSRNGKGYATRGMIHLNIKPGSLDDYSEYLIDVMVHFSKNVVAFDYLSPVNEPQWNWDGPGQEGTPALNEEVYALVRYLSHGLSAKGLKTRIVLGEAGTLGHAAMTMDRFGLTSDGRDDQARFFFSRNSPFYIGHLPNVELTISAHSYQSVWPLDKQVEYRKMFRGALQAANPELGYWQSEYCVLQRNDEIGGGGGRDLGMDTALYVARIIHHDLTVAHAKSWQWWTAVSQCDFKDGLVYLDDGAHGETGNMGTATRSLLHDGEVRASKLLWTLGNYARFIRPGMVRVGCHVDPPQSVEDGLLSSAYKDDKHVMVVVLINLSDEAKSCKLNVNQHVDVYTTSTNADLTKSRQHANSLRIPPRAVATVRALWP